jgi:Kef-type K+ transport system membrane component KefB
VSVFALGLSSVESLPPTPHTDPVAEVALALAIILVVAKIGSHLAERIRQPAVLGELVLGVVLGNLGLLGYTGVEHLKTDPFVDQLARLGVIVLLFEVGLESTVKEMMRVGGSALAVAALGVAAPFTLGWLVSEWWLPEASAAVHAFVGATLTATSVGITARVLKDIGRSTSEEARVILGAAVIDDVLSLLILAAVTAIVGALATGRALSVGALGFTLGKAAVFLVGSLVFGITLSSGLFSLASRLRASGILLPLGLAFCFLFASLADAVGLAAIVGAFAAGLVLEDTHFRDFVNRGERSMRELIHPISAFLAPVFFILMGMRTDLRMLGNPSVFALAGGLTVVAVVGKQACSLGVFGIKADRLTVGLGMIPRGEVGLIFASIGAGLSIQGHRVIDPGTFSAIVIMVIATTFMTPPALAWSFQRKEGRTAQASGTAR